MSSLKLRGSARGWQSVFHFENVSVRYFLSSNWGSLYKNCCRWMTHYLLDLSWWPWHKSFYIWKWISRFNWLLTYLLFIACSFTLLRKCWGHSQVIKSWAGDTTPTHFCRALTSFNSCRLCHTVCTSTSGSRTTSWARWLPEQRPILQDQAWGSNLPLQMPIPASLCRYDHCFHTSLMARWALPHFYVLFVALQDFCFGNVLPSLSNTANCLCTSVVSVAQKKDFIPSTPTPVV